VLGGSGSINGMAYYRGPAKDFDDWAALGNPGWSYADLLPYFLRSEHNPEYEGSPYHADGGPMGVSFPPSRGHSRRRLERVESSPCESSVGRPFQGVYARGARDQAT
jgi:choline dehydrogenase-like flavoprotein